MFSSRKNSTQRSFHLTQSLFQFLKRKKQGELQTSLKTNSACKSGRKDFHNRARSVIYNTIDQFVADQTYKNENLQNYNSISQSVTPRKIRFDVQKKQSLNKANSLFIQMISPLKNKNNSFSNNKQKQAVSTKKVQKGSDFYSKKRINESINLIKNTFHKFLQAGQSTKQKCNTIFCRLSKIYKIFQQGQSHNDKTLSKKISQLKVDFKAIQSILSVFDSDNTNQILEQFHKMLSEHLNSIQSYNTQHFKKQAQQQINLFKNESQLKQKQNEKIISEITRQKTLLQKNIDKIQKQLESTVEKFQEREFNFIQQKEKNTIKLQARINELLEQNQKKDILLKETQKNLQQLQKSLKDQKYTRAFLQKKQSKEQQLIRQTRESFLVQEIQRLKKQFTSDVDKLHILYQTKNQQLNSKIVMLQKQLDSLKGERIKDKQVLLKIIQETTLVKQQNNSLAKKNDSILIDMYRMNEQLYQHWLALKDIQTLSQRLNIFQNFRTIYKDLSYNPILFN